MDLLQAVLPMILGALTEPKLAPIAALTFRDVCGECAEQLSPFVVQLIPACQVGAGQVSVCKLYSLSSVELFTPYSAHMHP